MFRSTLPLWSAYIAGKNKKHNCFSTAYSWGDKMAKLVCIDESLSEVS